MSERIVMGKYFLKQTVTYSIIWNLINSPTAVIHAQDLDIGQIFNQGMSVLNSFAPNQREQRFQSQREHFVQQNIAYTQKTAIAGDKYFPWCKMPVLPPGACALTPEPNQTDDVETINAYMAVSGQYINHFSQYVDSDVSTGKTCFNKSFNEAKNYFDQQTSGLENHIKQIEDEIQRIKDEVKPIIEDINSNARMLYGGTEQSSETKDNQMSKQFSPECQNMIGVQTIEGANRPGKGLESLEKLMHQHNKTAQLFRPQEHTDNIEKKLKDIQTAILNGGIEGGDYGRPLAQAKTTYPRLEQVMQQAVGEQLAEIERNRSSLKGLVGYDLPKMDHLFDRKVKNFNAPQFYRQEYLKDCLFNKEANLGEILPELRHNSSGSTVDNYIIDLQKVLAKDILVEDKVTAIRKLDENYQNDVTILTDGAQGKVSPSQFFASHLRGCENKMNQKSDKGTSLNETISEVDDILKKTLSLNKTMSAKLYNAAYEDIINCSGRPVLETTCTLEQVNSTLNPKMENFCVANASTCKEKIKDCYNQSNVAVRYYRRRRDQAASIYNGKIRKMEDDLKNSLASMKRGINTVYQGIDHLEGFNLDQLKLNEINYVDEESVDMPQKFGVALKGGGNFKNADRLLNNMKMMKEKVKKQKDKVIDKMKKNINDNWKRELKKWSNLHNLCQQRLAEYAAAVQAMEEAQAEEDEKVNNFCKKYDEIRTNPGPGCALVDDLASDSEDIAHRLNPELSSAKGEFKRYCDSVNNEPKKDSDEEKKLSPVEEFTKACENNGGSWDSVLKAMKEKGTLIATEEVTKQLENIESSAKNGIEVDLLSDSQFGAGKEYLEHKYLTHKALLDIEDSENKEEIEEARTAVTAAQEKVDEIKTQLDALDKSGIGQDIITKGEKLIEAKTKLADAILNDPSKVEEARAAVTEAQNAVNELTVNKDHPVIQKGMELIAAQDELLDAANQLKEKLDSRREQPKFKKVKNLCKAQKYLKGLKAVEECLHNTENSRKCYKDEIENSNGETDLIKKIGETIAELDTAKKEAEKITRENEIGEYLAGIGCEDQPMDQGRNGFLGELMDMDESIEDMYFNHGVMPE